MTEAEIDEIVEIERDLFRTPWSRTSFLFEVTDSRTSFAVTARSEGELVGYAIGWFVADELHIGNIAVVRDRQGRGIGNALLLHLLDEAVRRQVRYVTLEVRASNVRAISLYRRHGFKGIAIRKRYYSDDGEDAMVMLAEIGRQVEPCDPDYNGPSEDVY
jgi:ribosomal-protein-alanine N-acetyltransferase